MVATERDYSIGCQLRWVRAYMVDIKRSAMRFSARSRFVPSVLNQIRIRYLVYVVTVCLLIHVRGRICVILFPTRSCQHWSQLSRVRCLKHLACGRSALVIMVWMETNMLSVV